MEIIYKALFLYKYRNAILHNIKNNPHENNNAVCKVYISVTHHRIGHTTTNIALIAKAFTDNTVALTLESTNLLM